MKKLSVTAGKDVRESWSGARQGAEPSSVEYVSGGKTSVLSLFHVVACTKVADFYP